MKLNVSLLPQYCQKHFEPEFINTTRQGYRDWIDAHKENISFNPANGGPVNTDYRFAYEMGAEVAMIAHNLSQNSQSFTRSVLRALGRS